ncbi:MAG: hypothetical protein ACTHL8_05635 [Burkholderiaceae bacterium]
MTSRSHGCAPLAVFAALALHASVARADYLATWVAATCDVRTGRAMVRFGYADAEDAPVFDALDPAVDGGLSLRPPDNASQYEAGCRLGPAREVKVRLGEGAGPYGETSMQFSVWVDGIRVVHGSRDDRDARAVFAHSYLIDRDGLRECVFDSSARNDPDALTSEAGARRMPVECDVRPRPIAGRRDLVEYPPGGRRPLRAGTLVVAQATDRARCTRLIVDGSSGAATSAASGSPGDRFLPPPPQRVAIEALGHVLGDPDWQEIAMAARPSGVGSIKAASLDAPGDGSRIRLYLMQGEVAVYDRAVLLLPPSDVRDEDVRRLAESADGWDGVVAGLRARGWPALGLPGAPLQASASGIDVAAAPDGTYVLVQGYTSGQYGDARAPRSGLAADQALILLRPDGTRASVCAFHEVPRHF